jgi:hypothetical protein
MWYQIGSGHVRNAEYCKGELWQNGFLVVHADTQLKTCVMEPVEIRDFCVFGGEFYTRNEDEVWYKGQTTYPQLT